MDQLGNIRQAGRLAFGKYDGHELTIPKVMLVGESILMVSNTAC